MEARVRRVRSIARVRRLRHYLRQSFIGGSNDRYFDRPPVNFCRKHASLKGQTPAMAAGLTEYRWTVADMLSLDMWSEAEAA